MQQRVEQNQLCEREYLDQQGGFFGRRHGKALRDGQKSLFTTLLPGLKLDLSQAALPDLHKLFSADVQKTHLEIGFGGGEHLYHAACHAPHIGFIGVEPFVNGMAKLLSLVEKNPERQKNIRLFDADALLLLDWLPPSSLDAIDLFYADPWPKKKHWKRRFVQTKNLDRFARVLKPKGIFRFASDIDHYVNWTLRHCQQHEGFNWLAASQKDWHEPYENWPSTRYEAKALREGRRPAYLRFERV